MLERKGEEWPREKESIYPAIFQKEQRSKDDGQIGSQVFTET